MANTECRIVDPETGDDSRRGRGRRALGRGPQVMLGYLNNPGRRGDAARTAGSSTGDVARLDADGHLFIVDRVKELIKVKGFQVAPAELEAVLLTHPAVADVAVIGIADESAARCRWPSSSAPPGS